MKNTILLTIGTFTVISCSTNLNFQQSNLETPKHNSVTSKNLNEQIYYYENLTYRPAVKIVDIQKDNNFFQGNYPFTIGDVIPLTKETKKLKIYTFKKEYIKHSNGGMVLSDKSKKFGNFGIVVNAENKAYPAYAITDSPAIEEKEGIKIVPAKYTNVNCDTCIVKELIYTGKTNNILKFSYKEYTRDLTTPQTFEVITLDLNNGNTLSFKNITLEVTNSSEKGIEYKIYKK